MQGEDEDWIGRIGRRGPQAESALKSLFLKYQGKLKRYFQRHRMSAEDSEELVQEVFIRVLEKADSFEHRASGRAWIYRIAHNCMVDLIRRRGHGDGPAPNPPDDDDEGGPAYDPPDPSADGRNYDYQLCVRDGIRAFTAAHPDRAHALTLVAEDWSGKEIAEALDRGAGATREYLSQCRKVLEKFIAHCLELLQPGHHDTGGRHG